MEWLVVYRDSDLHIDYCDTKTEVLETVRNLLEHGNVALDDIQVFEAKRKKIVIDIEGETE